MTPAIQQRVRFRATPRELFEIYMNSKKHSDATGEPAKISRKAGGKFTAFGKMLKGRNLVLVPDRMIAQTWRGPWKKRDPDSILVITFEKARGGTIVDLVHVNVPGHDHRGVRKGWPKYYWKPWKKYLSQRKRR